MTIQHTKRLAQPTMLPTSRLPLSDNRSGVAPQHKQPHNTDQFEVSSRKSNILGTHHVVPQRKYTARPTGMTTARAMMMGVATKELPSGPQFFSTAPKPQDQATKLKPGQHTGFHNIREQNGRFLLDTSDAIRLEAAPEAMKEMIENGSWANDWWGGTSSSEKNPTRAGEVANFDFVPDTASSQLPGLLRRLSPDAVKDAPLAKLNISIKEPQVTQLENGRSVTTYRASLNPHGNNPGDEVGRIKQTGDVSGDMRIHVVDNGDGTSTFQLDWHGMVVEPKGPMGLLEGFDPSHKANGFASGMRNSLKRDFINIVGEGHNDVLRPKEGHKSGFALMASRLDVGSSYDHNAIPFQRVHPDIAKRNGL